MASTLTVSIEVAAVVQSATSIVAVARRQMRRTDSILAELASATAASWAIASDSFSSSDSSGASLRDTAAAFPCRATTTSSYPGCSWVTRTEMRKPCFIGQALR